MRMSQTKNTRLIDETVKFLFAQMDIQNFHGDLRLAMDVLSKIHIAEGAFAKQAYQTIVIKLLARPNCHIPPLLHEYTSYRTQWMRLLSYNGYIDYIIMNRFSV